MSRWMHAHLAAREDEINRSMAGTGVRLCFHADRTVTQGEGGMVRTECDYCPAWAVDRNGMPDLFPFAFTEKPCAPSSS